MDELEETILENFKQAFNKQIGAIAKAVAGAVKNRKEAYLNLQIEVIITDEPLPHTVPLDKLSTTVVIKDLADRKIRLDERSN